MMKYSYVESPISKLLLFGDQCLEGLVFPKGKTRKNPEPDWIRDSDAFYPVKQLLDLYFQGQLTCFDLEVNHG